MAMSEAAGMDRSGTAATGDIPAALAMRHDAPRTADAKGSSILLAGLVALCRAPVLRAATGPTGARSRGPSQQKWGRPIRRADHATGPIGDARCDRRTGHGIIGQQGKQRLTRRGRAIANVLHRHMQSNSPLRPFRTEALKTRMDRGHAACSGFRNGGAA
ncbi:hypothetical protein ATO9_03845 [Pseudooceanicola atlanticus]|uniref:Uncharacterized protein n=1 Tax=Pseudooceanicola atlanticus TaxID=1461694 RepID=A0A0A0EKC8_9RHOB|nr:hypothetical protein ATO9_03845 [Pseudooceanicola atlanticus]